MRRTLARQEFLFQFTHIFAINFNDNDNQNYFVL